MSMDPGVRGPRCLWLAFPGQASSHLKLVGLPLRRLGWEWKWRCGTHRARLDPTPSTDRASPSTRQQWGARILGGQEKDTEIPKHWKSLGTFNGQMKEFYPPGQPLALQAPPSLPPGHHYPSASLSLPGLRSSGAYWLHWKI